MSLSLLPINPEPFVLEFLGGGIRLLSTSILQGRCYSCPNCVNEKTRLEDVKDLGNLPNGQW